MGHALANFEMTGEQLLQPEISFSCFWNTRWIDNDSIENQVWDALDKNGSLNASGFSLMIWGNYLGDKMIKTTSSLHTRTFASIKSNANKLFVYIINKDDKPQIVQLNVQNKKIRGIVQSWELSGKDPNDCKPSWNKVPVGGDGTRLRLNGTSIRVVEYQLE
jgi:hypothetical protein